MRIFTIKFILFLCIGSFMANSVKAQTSYCTSTLPCYATFYYSYFITHVQLGNLNNYVTNPSNACIHDYTTTAGDTATITAGVPTTITINDTGYSMSAAVYIDMNSNGNFTDPGEMLYSNMIWYTYNNSYTPSITVPANLPTGYYRMRVMAAYYYQLTAANGCGSANNWGAWHDYTLYVAGTTCNPGIVTQPVSATRCVGGADTFTVSAIGSNLNYQWYFNGTAIPSADSSYYIISNIATTNAGNYTCNVTNSSCSGAGTLSNTAVLTVNPLPVIAASGPLRFCPGASVTLTSSASTGNQWQRNDTNIYNATSNSYIASIPGIYTVVYTNGCPSTSLPDTVANFPAPNPVISPAGIAGIVKICTGSTQVFTTTTGTGWSYQWKRNGTSISGANGTSYIAILSGSYTMTNTNTFGCTTTSTPVQLQVNIPPSSTVTNIGSKILCAGGFKTLYASSSDAGATFQWQFNGVNINGATSATYNAYTPGNYTVIAYNGCYVTSLPLTLTTLPFPTLTANGPTTFCIGSNVKLTSSITDTAGVQYQWMRNGNNITNANSTSYIVTDSGTYQVLIVVDSACTAMSTPQTVMVYPAPQPVVIATGNGYTLNTTQVYTTYQWYWNTKDTGLKPIAGATNYNYSVVTSGYYAASVTDFNGCTGMSNPLKITVISPNGVNNINNSEAVKIYPNPANTVVYISAPMKVNVSISSLDGRLILQQNEVTNINISDLATGMYIIRINDTNGNPVKVDKLIKD